MSAIVVRLLGVPEIVKGRNARAFPRRAFWLLALLALEPGRRISRAKAAARLWDSDSGQSGMVNLRQMLLRLQRAEPGLSSVLNHDDRTMWLVDPNALDICQFLDLDCSKPEQALRDLIGIYRGELLDFAESKSEDAPPNTIIVGKAYLQDRYFALLDRLLKAVVRYGTADASLLRDVEHHALSIDDLREETYRGLIAAYGGLGRKADAQRVYSRLCSTLRLDGIDGPTRETLRSLAHAVTRSVNLDDRATAPGPASPTALPRIALLAPNWADPGQPQNNTLRLFVEDMAHELARYKTLTTLAAHSTFRVNHDGGIVQDNTLLRADYAVASTVRAGPDLGTLVVRLTDNRSGGIVWSGEFPLLLDNLSGCSRVLVARIAAELTGAVETDVLAKYERTAQPNSFINFLSGQDALKTCDLRSVRRARKFYRQSIAADERFAEAYSGASWSLYLEWLLLGGREPKLLSEARELADMAIERGPGSSSGYWRKAMVALYQRDFDESEECFQHAQALHPNCADIMLDHSDAMGFVGDPNQAWTTFNRALDLNPIPPDHYWWAGASIAFSKEEYETAIDLCAKLDSDESVLRLLAASHGRLGNRSEAREYGSRLKEMYPGESAEEMTRLQPHRTKADMDPFIEGLRLAGIA